MTVGAIEGGAGFGNATSHVPPFSRPVPQLMVLLPTYLLHVVFIAPLEIPAWGPLNGEADNLVASAVVAGFLARALRRPVRDPSPLPWAEVPSRARRPLLLFNTTITLCAAFFVSGYIAAGFELILHGLLRVMGLRLSSALHHALQILVGHLTWVFLGSHVLGTRLAPFFPPPWGRGSWMRVRWRAPWLGWVAAGYAASLLGFNAVDGLGVALFPPSPHVVDSSAVGKLLHPVDGGWLAHGLGSVGPILTGPVFEEVLYRGFLLPALCSVIPLKLALPLQALVFGAHHNNLRGFAPLSMLGLVWGLLYIRSANLLVPTLVHVLWNLRIFVAALL